MTKKRMAFWVLGGAVFAGSFMGTALTRSQPAAQPPCATQPALARWLGVSEEAATSLEAADPLFAEDLARLRGEVDAARSALIGLFEKADVTDDDLRAQIEAVIAANGRLEHRVADYLIAVRGYLTPEQQKKLFGLCANEVRQCARRAAGLPPCPRCAAAKANTPPP